MKMKNLTVFLAAMLLAGVVHSQDRIKLDRSAAITPDTTKLQYLATDDTYTFTTGNANVTNGSATVARASGTVSEWNNLPTPSKFYISGAAETEEYLVSSIASNQLTLETAYQEATDTSTAYTVARIKPVHIIRIINTHASQDYTVYLIDRDGTVDAEGVTVEAGTEVTLGTIIPVEALGVEYSASGTGSGIIELYRRY